MTRPTATGGPGVVLLGAGARRGTPVAPSSVSTGLRALTDADLDPVSAGEGDPRANQPAVVTREVGTVGGCRVVSAQRMPREVRRRMLNRMTDSTQPGSPAVPLAAFAAGAVVSLLVGFFATVHGPTLAGTTTLGFRTVIDMKVALTLVVGVLAVLQLLGALWMYGRLGPAVPSWLPTAHRVTGAATVLLVVVVSYHCLWTLGLVTGTWADGRPVAPRTVVHALLGCAVIGAFVVKVVAVRSRRAPGWFLPAAGGLLFALLIGAVTTSALWYVAARGWPVHGR